jgi:signal transduction histidine kinase/CheY-like chemotaxis protein/HPt (histidine-containing phosphotransfer) domain-containing protein
MTQSTMEVKLVDSYQGGEVEKLRSRMQLCSEILQSMRQSNCQTDDVTKILETVVIKLLKLLNAVHVSFYKLSPITHTVGRMSGQIVAEAIAPNCDTCSQIQIENILHDEYAWIQSTKGEIFDLYTAGVTRCEINLTEIFAGKAYLLVPIVLTESDQEHSLWGFLTVHHCSAVNSEPFQVAWDHDDVVMLQQIAMQIEIILQQENRHISLLNRIGDMKLSHKVLSHWASQFRSVLEQIPSVSYVLPIANTPEFSHISPQIYELLGVTSGEWNAGLFNSWADYVHPDDRERVIQEIGETIETGASFCSEYRLVTTENKIIWVRDKTCLGFAIDGTTKVLYGSAFDISDRKLIEQNLRESEARLIEAQSMAKLGNWQWDLLSNKVIGSNEYFKILCLDPNLDGFFYGEISHIFVQDDRKSLELAMDRARNYGESYCRELRIPQPDNSYRYLEAIGHAESDTNGEVIRLYGTLQDISDRKKIEAKLQSAKLSEATIHAKSEFLAVMSHELRTPVNAVIGMTEILGSTPLSTEQQQYLATIRQGGEILLSVVNNVLDFSRIESGHFELEQRPFNLHQCVDQLLELMTTCIAAKSLELSVLINPDVPKEIMGDHICLRQILINLVSNAIKFTERGEIVITVTSQLSIPETNSYKLVFSVRDTGIGIAPKDLHNLFKSFGQANSSIARQYGGTGLGLVICKQLCELMGGAISVNSTLGEGSTFSFSIMASAIANPIKESAPDHEGIAEHIVENLSVLSERELNLEGKRILLVCSNPNIGQAIVMYTKAWHICTQIAESGSEAMLLFESANFDAVLIDENLGEMDALELANDIHQIFSDLKLVLLAFVKTLPEANGFENAKSRSSKFVACINKPITSSKLYQTLINIFYPEQAQPIRDGVDSANISVSNPSNLQGDMGKDLPLSILIVEDNPINQQLLSKMLKKLSYQAEVVDNGQKAVEAETQKMSDIIFMDLQMPIMDGLTATKHIRQMPQRQPWIIGISANSFSESQKSALAVGMNEYLTKPLHSEGLIAAIKRISKSVPQGVLQIVPEISIETSVSKPNNSSIDLTIFTSIENSVGKENLLEIIDNYFNQAEQEIANMRAAFNKQDIVTLEANNHSLKGGSGLFGATKLLKLCRSLQFMCRICLETNEYAIDDINQIGLVLQNIGAEYDLVKQALKSLQQSRVASL